MYKFAYGILFVCACLPGSASSQMPFDPLPVSEKNAAMMLMDGTLDSVAWLPVREFYANPVNVPRGELKLLIAVFPGSLSNVPTEQRELAGYEPWSKMEIDRFFEEYPELVPFKPILVFNPLHASRFAQVTSSLRSFGDSAGMFTTQATCSPARPISIRAQARFSAASAYWQRRSIRVDAPQIGVLTIGNFDLNMDNGLVYGRFPALARDTQQNYSWRFPETPAWNGVLYECATGVNVRGTAFFHARSGETIYGARAGVALGDHARLIAGASHTAVISQAPSGPFSRSYAHAGLTITLRSWEGAVYTGIDRDNMSVIPLTAHVKSTGGNAGFEASFTRIPDAGATALSAAGYACSEKISGCDSLRGHASAFSMQCRLPILSKLRSSCGIAYYYALGKAASENYAAISGSGAVDYEARYSFRRSTGKLLENHGFSASAAGMVMRSLRGKLHCRCMVQNGAPASIFSRLEAALFIASMSEIVPFITWYRGSGSRRQATVGFTQTMRLGEKISSELMADFPVFSTYTDRCTINAKAYFCF